MLHGRTPALPRQRIPQIAPAPIADRLWNADALAGVCLNELTPHAAHRAAAAFADVLQRTTGIRRPTIVIAGDGRPITSEIFAAAAEALRWMGADVIEIGSVWSGPMRFAVRHLNANGGLLVGNDPSMARTASLSFYGADGCPWSLASTLQQVQDCARKPPLRPTRKAGSSARQNVHHTYMASCPQTPAISRSLRVVFDTLCGPLDRALRAQLPPRCQLLLPTPFVPSPRRSASTGASNPTHGETRARLIARSVIAETADFGIWIDGLGEACTVIDDRGLPVPAQTLVRILARCPWDELDMPSEYCADGSRETITQQLETSAAQVAGDSYGRVWLRHGNMLHADASLVFSELLRLLDLSGSPLRKLVG